MITFTADETGESPSEMMDFVTELCQYEFRDWVAENSIRPEDILQVTTSTLYMKRNSLPGILHTLTVVYRTAPGTTTDD